MEKALDNLPVRIGEALLAKNYISLCQLAEVLELQKKYGHKLGWLLLSEGYVTEHQLYQTLAEVQHRRYVDLTKEPANTSLLEAEKRGDYIRLDVLPWRYEGNTILLAVAEWNSQVEEWIIQHYGQNYHYVMTSPYQLRKVVQDVFARESDQFARNHLWYQDHARSSKGLFSLRNDKFILLSFLTLFLTASLFPVLGFLLVNLFYMVSLLFKTTLIALGIFGQKMRIKVDYLWEKDLPIYSILVPLYQEASSIPSLLAALEKLDYPKAKLDIKLIVEVDDEATIAAIQAYRFAPRFEVVKVPYSLPRTKPKALNYALQYVKGEYVTIYDAEDRPEPDQLKKVVATFAETPQEVCCVQAKLNYYNRQENMLTRMFALEYATWFDFKLRGLDRLQLPIPLGGTSNHFKVDRLKELYGWDPYNVTEDADLGMRLSAKGGKVALVDSTTWEEAPVGAKPWLAQRSRWIKGYMQTYFVHMRHPFSLLGRLGLKGFCGFQLFIGAPCLIFLISPIMWLIWLGLMTVPELLQQLPEWSIWVAWFNLCIGLLVHVLGALLVVVKHKWWSMTLDCICFPCYWILHSLASFKALWQLITKPHYWEKTQHGVSRFG